MHRSILEEAIDNAVMASQGRMAATEEAEVEQNSGVEEQTLPADTESLGGRMESNSGTEGHLGCGVEGAVLETDHRVKRLDKLDQEKDESSGGESDVRVPDIEENKRKENAEKVDEVEKADQIEPVQEAEEAKRVEKVEKTEEVKEVADAQVPEVECCVLDRDKEEVFAKESSGQVVEDGGQVVEDAPRDEFETARTTSRAVREEAMEVDLSPEPPYGGKNSVNTQKASLEVCEQSINETEDITIQEESNITEETSTEEKQGRYDELAAKRLSETESESEKVKKTETSPESQICVKEDHPGVFEISEEPESDGKSEEKSLIDKKEVIDKKEAAEEKEVVDEKSIDILDSLPLLERLRGVSRAGSLRVLMINDDCGVQCKSDDGDDEFNHKK